MQICLCWLGQPDWNAVTAIATTVLTVGVWIAFLQLGSQRKATRAVEAGQLISMWQNLPISTESELLDRDPDKYQRDRERVLRLYRHIKGLEHFRRFRALGEFANNFIEDAAQLAERIEIYVRKGVADEGIICEHLGYYVLTGYQILRDVLNLRARNEDLDYEGFRDLAVRVQDYAIVFPLDTGFPSGIVWDQIPLSRMEGPPARVTGGVFGASCNSNLL